MLTLETVRIQGQEHVVRPRSDAPPSAWAHNLIEDPQQQHLVHLLVNELLPTSRSEWTALMVELETVLDERYELADPGIEQAA